MALAEDRPSTCWVSGASTRTSPAFMRQVRSAGGILASLSDSTRTASPSGTSRHSGGTPAPCSLLVSGWALAEGAWVVAQGKPPATGRPSQTEPACT